MKKSYRSTLIVVVVALLAVVGIVSRNGGIEVAVASATRDTVSMSIAVEGRTRARDSYTIVAPVSGRLQRIEVREGDVVEEGHLLARLTPAPQDPRTLVALRAEVEIAEARVREARIRLREASHQRDQAEKAAERRRSVGEVGGLSRELIEQAELAAVVADERFEGAEAAVTGAEAALSGAQARLLGEDGAATSDTPEVRVRAPVSGRVLSVPDASERPVMAGSPLLVLADSGGLEVVLDVLSEDAVVIQPGQPLVVSRWGGPEPLAGVVSRVTMSGYTKVSTLGVEEQRVDVVADLHHAPQTLGTGYRVSGDIIVWQGSDALVVPVSSVFRAGGEWRVFVVEGNRARSRRVVLDQRNERAAVVVEGLEEGDVVILFPSEGVEDGARVRVRQEG
jgi:HlyD family secretion protein